MRQTPTPVCSHCGTALEHDEMWRDIDISKEDGDDSEITCKDCGKVFYVQCMHDISFIQTDEDGEELINRPLNNLTGENND